MKSKTRLLSIVSLIAAMALCLQLTASAASIDYTGNGYITILMESLDTKEPVPGAVFELFYVGEIDESKSDLTFLPAGKFVDSGVSFSDMSASKSTETAKALALYARANEISGTVQTTGSDGRARFLSLELGLYLIVPKNADYNTPFENLIPFLASVPMTVDEGASWNYGVNVLPKTKTAAIEEDTTKPETTAPDDLPQTGVINWPIPVLAFAGLLLFSFGWADIYIKRKKRNE